MTSADSLYARGLEIRKEVLGADHVTRSLEAVSDFARPMQELVTSFCWGAVWGSDDLDRRTRSIVNLAMLAALDRQPELGLHVRGALRNGCTVSEIRGTLLQVAVYCGVPSGIEAFRTAERVIADCAADDNRPDRSRS